MIINCYIINVSFCAYMQISVRFFDGAETCELVGSYLLSKIPPQYRSNIGLYRDDGLGAFDDSPRTIEMIKKEICKIFSENNLKITIEANKKCVNFLDITFDLRTGTFKPYNKPGNTPQYVHADSNHPPSILRRIPETINQRLSKISSDKEAFASCTRPYQEALRKSGYQHNLRYEQRPPRRSQNRPRNVLWYNPPFSSNVATDIGRKFLKAIDDCFPKHHPFSKIFNRNTLKLSYSCMPNVENIISAHNKAILRKENHTEANPSKECNCRQKSECPLHGKCLTQSIVYQATVKNIEKGTQETYVGLTEGPYKTRYLNHISSFRNVKTKHATELSKHIWSLKEANTRYAIEWRIVKRCKAYSSATKICNLCLHEKFVIMYQPKLSTLNKRNELISTCRHRKKHLLCNN